MRAVALLCGALALILAAASCGVDESMQAEIKAFIEANAEHAQQEDIEAYMSDLSADNVQRDNTRSRAAELFEKYNLSYTIDEIAIVKADGDRAVVRVKQSTRKVEGIDPFNDNQVELEYTLVRQGGAWKIQDSRVESIKRLY